MAVVAMYLVGGGRWVVHNVEFVGSKVGEFQFLLVFNSPIDQLSALTRKLIVLSKKDKRFLTILFLTISFITSCIPYGEFCDFDGEIYNSLVQNKDAWWQKLQNESTSLRRQTVQGTDYIIFVDMDFLIVRTTEDVGPSAGILGLSGYYYSISGISYSWLDELDYVQREMGGNIWCYHNR
jgi:hypothetical protein